VHVDVERVAEVARGGQALARGERAVDDLRAERMPATSCSKSGVVEPGSRERYTRLF